MSQLDENYPNSDDTAYVDYEKENLFHYRAAASEVFPSFVYCDERQLYEQMSPDDLGPLMVIGAENPVARYGSPSDRREHSYPPGEDDHVYRSRQFSTCYNSPPIHRTSSTRTARRRVLPHTPAMRRNCSSQVNLPSYVQRAHAVNAFHPLPPHNNCIACRQVSTYNNMSDSTFPKNLPGFGHRSDSFPSEVRSPHTSAHQSHISHKVRGKALDRVANDHWVAMQQSSGISPIPQQSLSSKRSFYNSANPAPPHINVSALNLDSSSSSDSLNSVRLDSANGKTEDRFHSTFVRVGMEQSAKRETSQEKLKCRKVNKNLIGKQSVEKRRSRSIEELRHNDAHLRVINSKRSPSSSAISNLNI